MPKNKGKVIIPKELAVTIIPTEEKVSKRIYSNFVQINHSPHDFTLTFCDILPVTDINKSNILKTQQMDAPIQAEIVLPHSLVEPLIKALSDSYVKFKTGKEEAVTIKESEEK